MKDLTTITENAVSKSRVGGDVFARTRSESMTDEQRQAVKYFFARLARVYQSEYRRNIPDESTDRATRQEFSHLIMNITKEKMDVGFDLLHEERKFPTSDYKFMNLDAVIELIKNGRPKEGVQDGAYRVFKPALPEPKEYKSRRKKVAEAACTRILSIFDE